MPTEEIPPRLVDDRVFIAVTEHFKDGVLNLLWALSNLDCTEVVIVHIHCPSQLTSWNGENDHYNQLNQELVKNYRMRAEVEEELDKYARICQELRVSYEKLIIEKDDVAKGLEELITLHGITKLVMGAAADECYIKEMKSVESKTALKLMSVAASTCDIWFTCNGYLICTRDRISNTTVPAMEPSPVWSLQNADKLDITKHREDVIFSEEEANEECKLNFISALVEAEKKLSEYQDRLDQRKKEEFDLEQKERKNESQIIEFIKIISNREVKDDEHEFGEAEGLTRRQRAQPDIISIRKMVKSREACKRQLHKLNGKKFDLNREIQDLVLQIEYLKKNIAFLKERNFSPDELDEAIQCFGKRLIGKGDSGEVYKGSICNIEVAIKLLRRERVQRLCDFEQKVAVLGGSRHPHLVALIGVCWQRRGLIYEFFPNGSLQDRLACANGTPPLAWQLRIKIIGEVCLALIFLHSNKPHPVVHGGLMKLSNILLDANFVSKLGDFGMDLDIQSTGKPTMQSDMYWFGIIVLRLMTGRLDPENLVTVVEEAMDKGDLQSFLDHTAGDWPLMQADQLARIGLRCAKERPHLAKYVWKFVEPLMKTTLVAAAQQLDDEGPPSAFICPISYEVMVDPHVTADGFTYELKEIEQWFQVQKDERKDKPRSPCTNKVLASYMLTPNIALRRAIEDWKEKQGQKNGQVCDPNPAPTNQSLPTIDPAAPGALPRSRTPPLHTSAAGSLWLTNPSWVAPPLPLPVRLSGSTSSGVVPVPPWPVRPSTSFAPATGIRRRHANRGPDLSG